MLQMEILQKTSFYNEGKLEDYALFEKNTRVFDYAKRN